jgi:hypothetical protein
VDGVSGHEASFAVLSGWPLIAALALVVLVAALVTSRRLLVFSVVVLEALLVFWVYSLSQLM